MKDIMAMSYEAYQKAGGNKAKQRELFTEMLFAELMKMGSADIAPHLTCNFDVMKHEYNITLQFPVGFCKTNSIVSNVE